MEFIDFVNIQIESGSGGDGGIYFRREKYVPDGGPAGGDGGDGGSVIFVADNNLHTLLGFKYKRKFAAEHGEKGRIKNQYGKKGQDLTILVPPGTVIKDKESGKTIADLSVLGQKLVMAKGGRGGRGNTKFATSKNKAPHYSEPGMPGIFRELTLELKSIADVGLVGLPNAGKSSLLSVISASKPKIANYPFTTLTPQLGVVKGQNGDGFVVADIPGLIEGAHKGIGLGHQFLRHVERTRMLVQMVDVSSEDPFYDFETISHELVMYPGEIDKKEKIVVLNKIDMLSVDEVEEIEEKFKAMGFKVFKISALTRQGTDDLMEYVARILPSIAVPEMDVVEKDDFTAETSDYKIEKEFNAKENNVTFTIDGYRIQKLLELTDVYDERALNRFMKIITGAGVLDKLKEMGAVEGDTVKVGFFQFDYFPDEQEEIPLEEDDEEDF